MDDGRRVLYVDYLDIVGPFYPSTAPPASHERFFICPHRPGDHVEECAGEVVTNLARRAYRRPVTAGRRRSAGRAGAPGASARRLFRGGDPARSPGGAALPQFPVPDRARAGCRRGARARRSRAGLAAVLLPLGRHAGRAPLFRLADERRLTDPAVLRAETHRMLSDPKARTLVTDFAAQWLQLRGLDRAKPDPARFPTVDDELRGAMRIETELFLEAMLREDRSVLDVLDAPFTFVNGPLARHYGIAGVDGEAFERVAPRRTAARRPAVARERADGLVLSDTHLARAARQVGAREPARQRATSGTSRGRPGPRSGQRRRRHAARADGGAPHESELRGLPQPDRPDRLRPGEVRRGRRLADARERGPDRRHRRAPRRHGLPRTGGTEAGAPRSRSTRSGGT